MTYVGTPDYGVEGCPPGYYRSVFVARADDPRQELSEFDGARFAYNEALSQSGWAAPQTHAAKLGLRLPPRAQTGGHRLSAQAVAEGRAGFAALDAVTWDMIAEWEPFASGLKVVGRTDPTPGLPYIAASGADAGLMFDVVAGAIDLLPAQDRAILRLKGLIRIDAAAYHGGATPPTPAELGMVDERPDLDA